MMYALYTAVALIGLVTLWVPLALVRRFTRGVPLNARAAGDLRNRGPRRPDGRMQLNRRLDNAAPRFLPGLSALSQAVIALCPR